MHTRSFVTMSALLLAVLGCRADTDSPTEPASPALTVSSVTALTFWQVSAGESHTCGVTLDNRAYCWGYNANGRLGDGTTTSRSLPTAVAGSLRFRQISTGLYHTCGVTTDYRAYCWGWNLVGQLGDATTTTRLRPVPVAGGRQFRQVDAGNDHTCGVDYQTSRAYCWGNRASGRLGDGEGTREYRTTPVAVLGGLTFKQVSAGGTHTCAVTLTNRAYCWGSNHKGQIGDSSKALYRAVPTRVASTRQFRQITTGWSFTCAVTLADRAFCWGNGNLGQIGDGKSAARFWPWPVAGGLAFTRVTAGHDHACGETTTDRAYCWGDNTSGAIGDGTVWNHRLTPTAVVGGLAFAQLSAGGAHTCGKTPAGVGYCWGANAFGELGDGSTGTGLPVPTRIAGPL